MRTWRLRRSCGLRFVRGGARCVRAVILAVSQMRQPENNDITIKTMGKALKQLEDVDTVILDRMCKVMPTAVKNAAFKGIKYYTCDLWHGEKHSKRCKCNPHVHQRLKRRLKRVNTSVAEQVFAWLRNFARTFNELRPARHYFLMLYYCRRHNKMIDDKYVGHRNKYSHKNTAKRYSKSYHCNKKNTKKAMRKVMKKVVKKAKK